MKKNLSFTFLLAVGLCTATTFVTCKFNAGLGEIDRFGFPFMFFSANSAGEIVQNNNFSGIALLIDFAICFIISYSIVSLISLLKVEKKGASLAH